MPAPHTGLHGEAQLKNGGMRALLVGYGKMGKAIEKILTGRGHLVAGIVDTQEGLPLGAVEPGMADVAIEFSEPGAAYQNIAHCLSCKIPVVCGTTGWLGRRAEVEAVCHENGSAFFYASNFSIGVNLFFRLNALLAQIMDGQPAYTPSLSETHHTAKKDAPSGTAISLAEGIIRQLARKNAWALQEDGPLAPDILPISAYREADVPGTHKVTYASPEDTIEIIHLAHSREGFARGAVAAAEWLPGKQGVFGMEDLLKL